MSNDQRQDKNQVFSPENSQELKRDPATGVPMQSKEQAMQKDFGLQVPAQLVPLPSKGVLYEKNHPFYMRDSVEIKAMTAREEDILTSQALIKKGTVVKELVRSCLVEKVDVDSLLTGDVNAIMVAVRITGYGEFYDATVACEACDKVTERQFNLAQIPIKKLKIEPVVPGVNEFSYTLPRTQKVVHFKFLTGHDENEINTTQERQKKLFQSQNDNSVTMNLKQSIISIANVTDKSKVNQFIEMMPAGDSRDLRSYIRKHEPGVIMKSWSKCEACGEESEVNLPFGVNFFWPSTE